MQDMCFKVALQSHRLKKMRLWWIQFNILIQYEGNEVYMRLQGQQGFTKL